MDLDTLRLVLRVFDSAQHIIEQEITARVAQSVPQIAKTGSCPVNLTADEYKRVMQAVQWVEWQAGRQQQAPRPGLTILERPPDHSGQVGTVYPHGGGQ